MSEIKSVKAKEAIDKHYATQMKGDYNLSTNYQVAKYCVSLAETEAEELHVKEIAKYNQSLDEAKQREQLSQNIIAQQRKQLQELRDKAVEAYRDTMLEHQVDDYIDCSILTKVFTQKLTEK